MNSPVPLEGITRDLYEEFKCAMEVLHDNEDSDYVLCQHCKVYFEVHGEIDGKGCNAGDDYTCPNEYNFCTRSGCNPPPEMFDEVGECGG